MTGYIESEPGPMFSACASEHSHGIQPTLE